MQGLPTEKRAGSSKREQLIHAAVELFSKNGIHATGIDAIVEHSGVTKKTLYAHFGSKEELILSALRHYAGIFRKDFIQQVEAKGATPKARILAVFDVAQLWFGQNNFYGCLFINSIGEYSQAKTPLREICKDYKRVMRGYIRELCNEAGILGSAKLADEVALLLEGAIVTAQVSENPKAAQIAKRATKVLISNAFSHQDSG